MEPTERWRNSKTFVKRGNWKNLRYLTQKEVSEGMEQLLPKNGRIRTRAVWTGVWASKEPQGQRTATAELPGPRPAQGHLTKGRAKAGTLPRLFWPSFMAWARVGEVETLLRNWSVWRGCLSLCTKVPCMLCRICCPGHLLNTLLLVTSFHRENGLPQKLVGCWTFKAIVWPLSRYCILIGQREVSGRAGPKAQLHPWQWVLREWAPLKWRK